MQNKDDSHRLCFALLRRVGTLLAMQLKDILSRHLRATLPEGESFFSRHLRTTLPERGKLFLSALRVTLPEGESNKKMLVIIKRLRFYLFDRSATFLYFIVFTATFLNAISLIYRLIAAYLPFNCKIRTSMRLLYLQNISGYLAS